jgi:hypothetical protein
LRCSFSSTECVLHDTVARAVAPGVGRVDVEVEGALGRAAAGEQAARGQLVGVETSVDRAHSLQLAQIVVIAEAPGKVITQFHHRAEEGVQLATGITGGHGVGRRRRRCFWRRSSAQASGSGGVLVVGDSLEELTSPYLKQYLAGVPLAVSAVGAPTASRSSTSFHESYGPSQSVIVFDTATNDNPGYPEILAGNLRKVAAEIGDRCMVVPTIDGLIVNGIDSSGKNRVVEE